MKKFLLIIVLTFHSLFSFGQLDCETTINYGSNSAVGKFAKINGIKMYYETYGDSTNQSLLLIHGNGGTINSERCQIEYFKNNYYVIVADSRFHGKSENGNEILTYELMTKDYNSLLTYLKIDSTYIIGQSDGGIIGLILAMNYPNKVAKLVTTAPNLRPDSTAVWQWDIENVSNSLKEIEFKISQGDTSPENIRTRELLNLMDKYPDIENRELNKIKAPTMIIAGDEDVIKLEHILEIYQNLSKAHLLIMPGATHLMLREEAKLFNQMTDRFISNPFKRPTTQELFTK